jgi:hypothetical protein
VVPVNLQQGSLGSIIGKTVTPNLVSTCSEKGVEQCTGAEIWAPVHLRRGSHTALK